jgi:hypothetical protein
LKFLGVDDDVWSVSILLTAPASAIPAVACPAADAIHSALQARHGVGADAIEVRSFRLTIPLLAYEQRVRYDVDGAVYSFVAPAKGAAPTCAYTSCNGFSDAKVIKRVREPNAMWRRMAERHGARAHHLLLMGGDQVYSDSMWDEVEALRTWRALPADVRDNAPFTETMRTQVDAFFFRLYLERWSQPAVAAMLAQTPTVMMWDDHDIFDGWGSYPDAQQHSPVYQGIYAIARQYFRLFQLHAADDASVALRLPGQPAYNYALRVGDCAILVLDLRSERTTKRVMSEASWQAVYTWLDEQHGCRHLFVMSSIPVVHPDFSTLETLLCALPGQQELQDDLQDHWLSRSHRQERLRLIHRLLDWAAVRHTRVTILSGDVHVGALGVIESDRRDAPANAAVINQLTSSGVVHPAPPAMALFYLEHVGDRVETVDRGITASMYPFPGTSHRYIGARNYLSLEPDTGPDAANRVWVNWWVEGEEQPYTKAIHPVTPA